MLRTAIVVADASRARLFTFTRSQEPGGIEESITEQRDLVNPARRHRPSELFSDSGRTGGLQYGFDDHREAHVEELDADFARTIAGELGDLARSSHADRLVICASPGMLGELRKARAGRVPELPLAETPHDLVRLSPSQLRQQLADYGFLPAVAR